MQLRYKKFRYDSATNEEVDLGDIVGIYRTERIGVIKHLPEHVLGESFDYVIIVRYSKQLYKTLSELFDVFKIHDNMIVVLTGAYIDESDYQVSPISEIPNSLVEGCYLIDPPSNSALKYYEPEERIKILDSIPFVSISKIIGFSKVGVFANHIILYNWLTLEPQLKVILDEDYNFTNLIDNNSKDYFSRNNKVIFIDKDLSEIYNNYLNNIYEKAKAN